MDLDIKGLRVLVTAGANGIGLAIAQAFAREGARVHVCDVDDAGLDALRKSDATISTSHCDVADRAAVATLFEDATRTLGGLDVLVNNAGGLVKRVPVAEIDDAVFDEIVDLNVRSLVVACAAGVPHMRRAKRGCIINVTSIAARHGGGPGAALYASSKAFVSTFTRGLARELAPENIRVNAVSPGVIATPFHERYSTPQMLESMRQTIPMGRLGTAEECAGTFVYLASDAMSGYVTGQVVEVNGGQLMP